MDFRISDTFTGSLARPTTRATARAPRPDPGRSPGRATPGGQGEDGPARVEPDDPAHAGNVHPDERGDVESWRRDAEDGLPEAGGGAVEQDDAHLPGTGHLPCVAAAPGDGGAHLPEQGPSLGADRCFRSDPDPGRVHPDEAQDGGGRGRGGGGSPHARPDDALEVQEIRFVRRGGGGHDRSQSHDGDRETCRHASLPSPLGWPPGRPPALVCSVLAMVNVRGPRPVA
jgi:hypothetical protein